MFRNLFLLIDIEPHTEHNMHFFLLIFLVFNEVNLYQIIEFFLLLLVSGLGFSPHPPPPFSGPTTKKGVSSLTCNEEHVKN